MIDEMIAGMIVVQETLEIAHLVLTSIMAMAIALPGEVEEVHEEVVEFGVTAVITAVVE